VSTGTCHYMGSSPVDLTFDLATWRERNYGTISPPPPFYQRFRDNVYSDIYNFIDPSLPNQRVDLFMEYLSYGTALAGGGEAAGIQCSGKQAIRNLFGKGGLLNSTRYLRIGFGRDGGDRVFRISGDWIKLLPKSWQNEGHIIIKNLGRLSKQ
jgi:hypothetical protein